MTARRHHFIPQCYLKGFAAARKQGKYQVHVFDRQTRKTFKCATENIGLERDFNRVNVEGHDPDAFEAGVAKFENELAPALARTIETVTFVSPEDRNLIMNLIANLALRNPQFREQIRQFHEQTSRLMMDAALSSKERWEAQTSRARADGFLEGTKELSYEQMKQFHDERQYKVELETDYHIRMEMDSLDKVLPLLAERGWLFLRAGKDSGGFVTSDHPVCLMWGKDGPSQHQHYSPGFGLKGTEVLFPLSQYLAIVGAFELPDAQKELSDEWVAISNGKLAMFATRQLYARDLAFHYQFPKMETRKASRLIDDVRFVRGR